jgi:hydrogenase nickel incorporation protein HypA/HybF
MHELAITEDILNIVQQHAAKANARRVTALTLSIGQLSSFVDESVHFCWQLLSQGTNCEGAELRIQRIAAEFLCLDCGRKFNLDGDLTPCPGCESIRLKVISGEQMQIDAIEIETD